MGIRDFMDIMNFMDIIDLMYFMVFIDWMDSFDLISIKLYSILFNLVYLGSWYAIMSSFERLFLMSEFRRPLC